MGEIIERAVPYWVLMQAWNQAKTEAHRDNLRRGRMALFMEESSDVLLKNRLARYAYQPVHKHNGPA